MGARQHADVASTPEVRPPVRAVPKTRPAKPRVRILRGDCMQVIRKRIAPESVNLIFTSPPYADQRKNNYGGIPPHKYVEWFLPRAQAFQTCLHPEGSFILNIKEKLQRNAREDAGVSSPAYPDWWEKAKPELHAAADDFLMRLEAKLEESPEKIVKRKNPFLFRTKTDDAQELVSALIDAFRSSSEETIFGETLENMAAAICTHAKHGRKSGNCSALK